MINIIKKVFLNQMRNPKWFLFLMLFPVFLIVLIGFILSSTFGEKSSLANVQAVVLDNSTDKAAEVIDAISSATMSVAKDYGIELSLIESRENGLWEARVNKKVFVEAEGNQIKVYYNDSDGVNGARVLGVFQGVANSVQVVEEIHDLDFELYETILGENNAYYELPMHKYADTNFMTSYDYYGVAEITLMILYLAMIPLNEIFVDRETKIKNRMKLAGISDFKYYISSLIAYLLVAVIAYAVSFVISIYCFDVNWGQYPIFMYAYLMLFAVFNIILGMFIAILLKNKGKIGFILAVIIIPILSFLGGSYSPFSFTFDTAISKLTLISPLRWVNLGIFNLLYNDSSIMMIVSVILLTVLSVIMFASILLKSRKDELMV